MPGGLKFVPNALNMRPLFEVYDLKEMTSDRFGRESCANPWPVRV